MSLAKKKRGWQNGDPPNSEKRRGKAASARKSAREGVFKPTGTEAAKKQRLMKQFTRLEGPSGNSEAYRNSPCWCRGPCGGRRLAIEGGLCSDCSKLPASAKTS